MVIRPITHRILPHKVTKVIRLIQHTPDTRTHLNSHTAILRHHHHYLNLRRMRTH